jgi:tetratricopeptide (TPR) repeat protein
VASNPRIDDLRKRLEKEPGSRLFAQLAEELRKDGELEEAIRVARDGLQKHPAYPSARMTLGRALLDTGDWSAARGEFELVLKSAADNILASRYLAECLENLGQRDAAIAQYKSTLALAPGEKHVIARLSELEGTGGAAKTPGPASAPGPAPAGFGSRPAAGLRPASARPDTGAVARPPAPPPPPVPAPPPTPPPPIQLATVEGEMELETSRSSAPAPRAPEAESPAPTPFAPIPLVDADEEFELERPYESPTTGIGLGSPADRAPAPAAPSAAAAAAARPAPAEDQEFELEAPHEAPSVGWAATIRPLPVMEEPAPTRAIVTPAVEPAAPPSAPAPAAPAAPAPAPPAPPAPVAAPKAATATAPQPLIPSTLTSPTLGELYFNQGFTDKAIEVYRDLVAREPENQRLGARLQELEKIQRSLSGGVAPAPVPPAPAPVPVPPPVPAAPAPVASAPPPPPPAVAPPVMAPPAVAETAVLEPLAPPPAPTGEGSRREAIERTIARLEGLLAAIRKG